MRALNLTLLTDLYELTMMQGYFKNPQTRSLSLTHFTAKNPCEGGICYCGRIRADCRVYTSSVFCTG